MSRDKDSTAPEESKAEKAKADVMVTISSERASVVTVGVNCVTVKVPVGVPTRIPHALLPALKDAAGVSILEIKQVA